MTNDKAIIEVEKNKDYWNIAKNFVHYHVALPLIECRRLVKVALFGAEEMGIAQQWPQSYKTEMRIEALYRLNEELKQMLYDLEFLMSKNSKKEFENIKSKLYMVQKYLNKVSYNSTDQRSNKTITKIDEKTFNVCLNFLREILGDIKKPIDKENLIFQAGDEDTWEDIERQIVEEG